MAQTEGNERQVLFANGRSIPLTHHELHMILRSRWMYGIAFISCIFWVIASLQLGIGWVSLIREHTMILALASLGTLGVTLAVYFGCLTLLTVALPQGGVILEPLLSALSVAMSMAFGYGITSVMDLPSDANGYVRADFFRGFLLYFAAMQIVVLSYVIFFRPIMIENGAEPAAEDQPLEQLEASEARINFGKIEVRAKDLICLNAKGHHVQVVTMRSTYEIRSSMASILPLLPEDLGMLIHRSHWVCKYGTESAYTEGGKLQIRLVDGSVVSVARSRKENVSIWLNNLDVVKK